MSTRLASRVVSGEQVAVLLCLGGAVATVCALLATGRPVTAAAVLAGALAVALVESMRMLRQQAEDHDGVGPVPLPDWTDAELAVLHGAEDPATVVLPTPSPAAAVVVPAQLVRPYTTPSPEHRLAAGEPVSWDDIEGRLGVAWDGLDAWLARRYIDATGRVTAAIQAHPGGAR